MSAAVVAMPDGSLARLDPTPTQLSEDGHALNVPGFPSGWCLLCGPVAEPGRCPEGDAQRSDNNEIADYVARHRVEGVTV